MPIRIRRAQIQNRIEYTNILDFDPSIRSSSSSSSSSSSPSRRLLCASLPPSLSSAASSTWLQPSVPTNSPLHAYQAYCPTTRIQGSKYTRGMKRKRRGGGGGGGGGGGKAQGRAKGAAGKKKMKTAKRYACDFCGYCTSKKGNLTTHMRTHTEERPYACDFCYYRASVKSSLTTHMRTHTGERPYACDFCDYRASTKGQLTSHIRRRHDGGDGLKQKKSMTYIECVYE